MMAVWCMLPRDILPTVLKYQMPRRRSDMKPIVPPLNLFVVRKPSKPISVVPKGTSGFEGSVEIALSSMLTESLNCR